MGPPYRVPRGPWGSWAPLLLPPYRTPRGPERHRNPNDLPPIGPNACPSRSVTSTSNSEGARKEPRGQLKGTQKPRWSLSNGRLKYAKNIVINAKVSVTRHLFIQRYLARSLTLMFSPFLDSPGRPQMGSDPKRRPKRAL